MQLDADSKIEGFETMKQQKLEFYLIIGFNVLMYLFLLVLIILVVVGGNDDFWIIARTFKSFIEVITCIGIVFGGIKLLTTVKKMMSVVPKNLLMWILVGGITSILKSGQQILYYLTDKENTYPLLISTIILISYNLTDLLPTLVFLRSFKVYSRFLRQNRDSIDSFDAIISEKLQTLDLD